MKLDVNEKAYRILDGIDAERKVFELPGGKVTVLDLGVTNDGGNDIGVGIKVAEATMGGLGKISVAGNKIHVKIDKHPAVATLSCQMAGWRMKTDGKTAIGSGPARVPANQPEKTIAMVGYMEKPKRVALLLETDVIPNEENAKTILEKSGAKDAIVGAFRGSSMVGLMNVMARVVEMGFYRMEHLKYDVKNTVSGEGWAPIPKITKDLMFTSNDALIYGGDVVIKTKNWDESLTGRMSSSNSPAYGRPFKEIFEGVGGDFYKIDAGIFAPAKIKIIDADTGREYVAGKINEEIVSSL